MLMQMILGVVEGAFTPSANIGGTK